jgi:hypothetical protein
MSDVSQCEHAGIETAGALLPSIVADGDALRRTYAVEATVLELTFIAGPPLALGLATLLRLHLCHGGSLRTTGNGN